jgi:dipeptidyl aminopeptidase/acylaminoacyl peptidase
MPSDLGPRIMRRRATGTLAVLTLCVAGCREGVAPFEARRGFDFQQQLTFGAGDDLAPGWTPDGERLIYYTDNYGPMPCIAGVMLSIPARGGTAHPILAGAQLRSLRPLVQPSISRSGERVAYFDLLGPTPDCRGAPVVAAFLRVRALDAVSNMLADHAIEVDDWRGVSWAPDDSRVAFIADLSLAIWRVGAPSVDIIPDTRTASDPAWAPDGERIAFATNTGSMATIWIINSDGTGRVGLGDGGDPAWSPDGRFVYAARGNAIVRIEAATGASTVVPGTQQGRAPAVSPDGRRLAFVRESAQMPHSYDVWVIDLP